MPFICLQAQLFALGVAAFLMAALSSPVPSCPPPPSPSCPCLLPIPLVSCPLPPPPASLLSLPLSPPALPPIPYGPCLRPLLSPPVPLLSLPPSCPVPTSVPHPQVTSLTVCSSTVLFLRTFLPGHFILGDNTSLCLYTVSGEGKILRSFQNIFSIFRRGSKCYFLFSLSELRDST